MGNRYPSPIGAAAGLDKDARYLRALYRAGFDHVEVGSVTMGPRSGNEKPRVWYYPKTRTIINRMGLPNDGILGVLERIRRYGGVYDTSLSIADPDGGQSIPGMYDMACRYGLGFVTINASCRNVDDRMLMGSDKIVDLLGRIKLAGSSLPIVVKVSSGIGDIALESVVGGCVQYGAGISIGNGDGVMSPTNMKASRSGEDLCEKCTRKTAMAYVMSHGKVPIIGVGGIVTAGAALQRILAGATLIQLYTGFVVNGLRFQQECKDLIAQHISYQGRTSVSEIVGLNADRLCR